MLQSSHVLPEHCRTACCLSQGTLHSAVTTTCRECGHDVMSVVLRFKLMACMGLWHLSVGGHSMPGVYAAPGMRLCTVLLLRHVPDRPTRSASEGGQIDSKASYWPNVAKSTRTRLKAQLKGPILRASGKHMYIQQSILPEGISNARSILHFSLELVYLLVVVLQ